MERALGRALTVAVLLQGLSGCSTAMLGDGTSLSLGTASRGLLLRGHAIPFEGDGYVMPPRWRTRGALYGTAELIGVLVRAGRAVARVYPGSTMGVADLSTLGGGGTEHHRSHQSGRDVDLLYYGMDEAGRPLRPADAMVAYGFDGRSRPYLRRKQEPPAARGWSPTPRRFDVARNWTLVRALMEDEEADIQWIFMAPFLRQMLLDYAAAQNEPPEVIAAAAALLHRPTDALLHDDHMHVRFYCDPADRGLGCTDEGPARWWKKHLKYRLPAAERRTHVPEILEKLAIGPGGYLASALRIR